MNLFTRQGRTLLLSAVAAIAASIFTSGVFAQDTDAGMDTAYVPFLVNVDATVKAAFDAEDAAAAVPPVQISVKGGAESFIRIPVQKTIGVVYGAQKQANRSVVVSNRGGKVTLNLPAQSYKNAVVALYSVDGKRILRKTVSASNAASNISRRNLANGAYILSVKGTGRDAVTSRLTHSGGGLDIKVAFGGENRSSAEKLAKKAAAGEWIITVSAAGHFDSSYAISPKAGMNATQTITLSEKPPTDPEIPPTGPEATYAAMVSSIGTGATGSGNYAPNAPVSITAGTAPSGYVFEKWTSSTAGLIFADENDTATMFIMPANAVTVTAVFAMVKYTVMVSSVGTGAAGGGDYVPGMTVNITAGTIPAGHFFKNWTSTSNGVVFANANNTATSFIMPANFVTVTANFETGFIDTRDNKLYRTVTIGGQTLMAENLNYETTNGSWCYDGSAENCAKYGRLYDWNTALDACPAGWHLPSRMEWSALAIAAGGSGDYGTTGPAGTKLKATSGWSEYMGASGNGTDDFGFSGLPGGYRTSEGRFDFEYRLGRWWTATEDNTNVYNAYHRISGYTYDYLGESVMLKTMGFSVRCFEGVRYKVTVSSSGTGATGNGSYMSGTKVSINAGTPPEGMQFKNWTSAGNSITFSEVRAPITTFTMPANAVTVTANFEVAPTATPTYSVTVTSNATDAAGGGAYAAGAIVGIDAGTPPEGMQFKNWTTTSSGVTFADANSATTTFTMPANAVTVTANFETKKYTVMVSSNMAGASGGGSYAAGAKVSIKAGTAPAGYVFVNWTSLIGSVAFANANSATTTFTMPSSSVIVKANFVEVGFVDARDGKLYKTVTIGSQKWMAENLNYETEGSWCYGNNTDNCARYGRLYLWREKMAGWTAGSHGVCPSGWRLPTMSDWMTLAKYAGGTGTYGDGGKAGTKLKSNNGWNDGGNGTNDFGFSALPGGYRATNGTFSDIGKRGIWWTSSRTIGDCGFACHTDKVAYRPAMGYNVDNVQIHEYENHDFSFSVRCIAD